jgi:hypothetical protein
MTRTDVGLGSILALTLDRVPAPVPQQWPLQPFRWVPSGYQVIVEASFRVSLCDRT